MTKKTAVILFNLGGPDSLPAVQPFLFNLFNDPAIIRLPNPFRWLLAKLISTRRAPVAREIYEKMGGRSPILPQTEAQARALETALGDGYRVFIAMRYWHPFSDATAKAVKDWGADRVVLLPLYPQFSTTTTASSFADWHRAAARVGLTAPVAAIGCYNDEPGFVAAQTALLRDRLPEAEAKAADAKTAVRILFSAHGLPKKIVTDGDPYQMQVERSVAAILKHLDRPGIDSRICYQSRVGPLEWIGPSTDAEIAQAAQDKRSIVVVPVAFVSEHSETLVELDIEYAELAQHHGAAGYIRVPTVGTQPAFIAGLAGLVRGATEGGAPRCGSSQPCGAAWRRCACAA